MFKYNTNSNKSNSANSAVNNDLENEILALEQKVNSVLLPPELNHKATGMIKRLRKMSIGGNFAREFEPVSEYINWIVQLPWNKYSQDNLDLKNAEEMLNKNHYGLSEVKTRLLEYLAIIKLQENKVSDKNSKETVTSEMKRLQGSSSHAPIMCFVGIQGVGKTTMAKSIANALGKEFVRIALGALGGVTELRGRSRGEIDAEPGQIVKALIRTGTMNPVILLDEIDKVSSQTGLRADVMAALLEILDPEQNSTFLDKYIDFPIDLSKVIFITTANNLGGISAALLDRLEVVRFGSYTDNDKQMIAKDYLLPKVRKATGLSPEQLSFSDDVWPLVIRPLGFDAGVRQLERTLNELARKVALQIVRGEIKSVTITKDNFRQYIPEQIGIYS